ncbi:MAG: hypothetical protein KatS3mg002_0655 [Candidatus Woesearchaeota archaeon]|nr:MAG: hypothetical protein KatS3mg002_0655 [Candidatus Woesearchaeota archaeon]
MNKNNHSSSTQLTLDELKNKIREKSNGIELIILYDKPFFYNKKPYIQYLDNYMNDFIFINSFHKVLESMSRVLDKQEFRYMLKSAILSNSKILNNDIYAIDFDRKMSTIWHAYLLESFLGDASEDYVVRGLDLAKKYSKKTIFDSISRNNTLCIDILSNIQSSVDYNDSKELSLLNWFQYYVRSRSY